MKIQANRDSYPPYLVRADVLENLWRRTPLYVGQWEGEPKRTWFHYEWTRESMGTKKIAFLTADVSIGFDEGGHFINFVNGRHRTRWLLQSRLELIPVGLYGEHIDLAEKLGLFVRTVSMEDRLVIS